MSELDDFLTTTLARQIEAEEALHNGDPTLRMQMWSTQDPVTLFGAATSKSGWDEVSQVFRWLASRFSASGEAETKSGAPALGVPFQSDASNPAKGRPK